MGQRTAVPRTSPGDSSDRQRSRSFFPGGNASLWAFSIVAILVVHLLATGDALRLGVLRGILLVTALVEAMAFVSYELRPRQSLEQSGRPYDPAYHGVMQDFASYNLAFATLLVLAALDPPRSKITIGVIVASYLTHALTHLFRYFGLYFGGGHPIPTRPQTFELRDGLQLAVPILGLLLFFPWRS